MKKTALSLIVVLSLVCVCMMPVIAAEADLIQPYYNRFVTVQKVLTLKNGQASYEGTAYTDYETDKVYVTAYLQQKVNGVWKTVDSCSGNGNEEATASNSCAIDSGYYYRVRVEAKVYNLLDYLLESVTEYSSEKYY